MAKQSYEGKRHKNAMVFKRRAELDYIVQVTLGCAAVGMRQAKPQKAP